MKHESSEVIEEALRYDLWMAVETKRPFFQAHSDTKTTLRILQNERAKFWFRMKRTLDVKKTSVKIGKVAKIYCQDKKGKKLSFQWIHVLVSN